MGAMVSWRPLPSLMAISGNDKYLAKIDYELGAKIYELKGEDYKLKKIIKLQERFPVNLYITDKGDLITYGQQRLFGSGQAQSDIVYIFRDFGKSLKTISAEMIYSKEEIDESILKYEKSYNCTPQKPWICHSEEAETAYDNELGIYDTLNNVVDINLETFEIKKSKSYRKCGLFDDIK